MATPKKGKEEGCVSGGGEGEVGSGAFYPGSRILSSTALAQPTSTRAAPVGRRVRGVQLPCCAMVVAVLLVVAAVATIM